MYILFVVLTVFVLKSYILFQNYVHENELLKDYLIYFILFRDILFLNM